jgi:hypothetical protein
MTDESGESACDWETRTSSLTLMLMRSYLNSSFQDRSEHVLRDVIVCVLPSKGSRNRAFSNRPLANGPVPATTYLRA